MIKQIAIAFLLLCGAPAWAQTFPELTGRVVDTADLLLALSAFETFDAMAGTERKIADVVPAMQSLIRAALGLG